MVWCSVLLLAHTSLTLRTSTGVDVDTARTPQTNHVPTYLPDEKPQGLVFARRPPAAAHGCRRAALASEFHCLVHAVMTWEVGIKVKYITSHLLLLLLIVLLLLLLLLVLPLLLLLVLASLLLLVLLLLLLLLVLLLLHLLLLLPLLLLLVLASLLLLVLLLLLLLLYITYHHVSGSACESRSWAGGRTCARMKSLWFIR